MCFYCFELDEQSKEYTATKGPEVNGLLGLYHDTNRMQAHDEENQRTIKDGAPSK